MNKNVIAILVASLSLAGCGGGSSSGGSAPQSTTLTGQFIDSAVMGLDYQTATEQGITDRNGEFNYKEGETITFSIGDLVFPATTAEEYLTPLNLAGVTTVENDQVINMVSLLMTLDTDGNPDNGITISPTASDIAVPLDFSIPPANFAVAPDVMGFVTNAGQDVTVKELVDAQTANDHMQDSLSGIDDLKTYKDYVGMFNLEKYSGRSEWIGIKNIYPDGHYLMVEIDGDETGLEYGKLGLKDGTYHITTQVDTNGDGGLTGGELTNVHIGVYDGIDSLYMTQTEDNCSGDDCTDTMWAPRVGISGNSIIGSWETQDGNASYNFRDDGKYFFAQIVDPNAVTGAGDIGIEVGNYTFKADSKTLTLDLIQNTDTSGASLLADNGIAYIISSTDLSEDAQTLTLNVDYNDGQDTPLVLIRRM